MAAGWQDRVMCDGMDHWMRFAIYFFLNEFEIIGFFLQGEEGREGGRGRRRKGRDFSGLLDLIHSIFYYFFVLLAFRGISRVWRIVESLEFLAIPKILRDSQRFSEILRDSWRFLEILGDSLRIFISIHLIHFIYYYNLC